MTDPLTSDLEIAVIGMACRFPGADTVEAFWQNLKGGVESVTFFSDDELVKAGVSRAVFQNPAFVNAAAILRDIEYFDAGFFGYTAREAQVLDPQHRLFLETSWEALESAGYDPERYRGTIGVFGGVGGNGWATALRSDPRLRAAVSPFQMMLSTEKDYLASRVAYKLDLRGPAVVIQTACSTSLVAVHVACQNLLAGECDMALAGGVSISVPQAMGHLHEAGGIASADGHCRAFDARANGTVWGTGSGVVVLKRLADALRDRDQVMAVIRGSAINNDGGRKVGFTAPGVEGQASAIRAAHAIAGLRPEDISYVEAHGTATALGDPIEVGALTQAFRSGIERRGDCAIGSVKTNIGHLDAAAGVAGFIKTVLMLKHRELVPSLHFEAPNPRIEFAGSPFYVATRHEAWTSDGPRRAGVSSFGIGGTNAHVVLEEPPSPCGDEAASAPHVLVVSARSPAALDRATEALALHLLRHPDLRPEDVAFTLRAGRRGFDHRRAAVCRDLAEGARLLEARDARRVWSGVAEEGRPVAFLFSGQGSQHPDMGRGLYESEPEFRVEVDECCDYLRPLLGLDLRRLLYPAAGEANGAAVQLNETRFTQPALFTVEHALARLWKSWGIVPAAMIGHSVGEYVAACVAGVLDRDEALALVAERARLMHDCPRGAMTAVSLSAQGVRVFLDGRLEVCVMNGPEACVVGGSPEDIGEFEERLAGRDIAFGRVPTSHAFHSALMEPALPVFAKRLASARLHRPRVPFVSNVTGTWITAEQATDPEYWVRHLREPVRFSEGLEILLEPPGQILLEVGPGQTLTALARRRLSASPAGLVLPSLRHSRQEDPDVDVFLQAAARLWCAGASVDWSPRDRRAGARRVTLPTYPFERERYWIDPVVRPEDRSSPSDGSRAATGKLPVERWLYIPTWKRAEPLPPAGSDLGSFCVLADEAGIGDALAALLRAAGAKVTLVRAGAEFAGIDNGEAVLSPGRRADYDRLLDGLEEKGSVPERFVHLWGVGDADESIDRGLLSVMFLGQALGRRQTRATSLLVVTSSVQDVLGDERISATAATVLGPCRVIPQEYPLIACRAFDLPGLDPSPLPGSRCRELAEAVLAEAASASPEPTVAYRGRSRFVPSFEPVAPPPLAAGSADPPRGLRTRGVYLVTGGLGQVGLALALYLARAVAARLVLTGRDGLPEPQAWDERLAGASQGDVVAERIRRVRQLEGFGSEVLVLGADVADKDAMRGALQAARSRFGRLDGVIHAAGDLGPGSFRSLDRTEREDCERQLRPKLRGAELLAILLGDEPIDFVMLTSSLSTVLGGLALGAYSAANHALDALARRQHRQGKRAWISVGWDAWQFPPAPGNGPAALAIRPEEGGEAFARLLALGPRPQAIVSTTGLEGRLAQWTRQGPVVREDAAAASSEDRHERPHLGSVYVPPEEPTERRLAAVWAELLGIDRVGLDDNFFELGGSSLTAVHLMGRIKAEYPGELSVTTLFEAPTVRALGAWIRAQGADPGLSRSADRGQMRKESLKSQRRTYDAAVE